MQSDLSAIDAYLQRRLDQLGLDEVPAVEAATWLDEARLLKDSPGRPGLPLRNLLRTGRIAQGEQRPPTRNGRWFIVRDRPETARPRLGGAPTDVPDHNVAGADRARSSAPRGPTGRDATPVAFREGHRTDTLTRAGLMARGFAGFERFKGIVLDGVPAQSGVYVVLRELDSRPVFLTHSPAGWFKGQNPTVPVGELETAWPDSAHCVYVGKAGPGNTGKRGLRRRIKEFRQYGDGRQVAHQGGRRIWQLADADDFIIAWLETPGRDPAVTEAELIRAFVAEHGKRPIGNRTSGRSSGG